MSRGETRSDFIFYVHSGWSKDSGRGQQSEMCRCSKPGKKPWGLAQLATVRRREEVRLRMLLTSESIRFTDRLDVGSEKAC